MKQEAFILFILLAVPCAAQITVPSESVQIKDAVMAAPEDKRAGAMIYGYNATAFFVVLRKGTNEMVCLSDDPSQDGFSVACYHKDLDVFMDRGRELKKQGKSQGDIFDIREAEVKSGKLLMPKGATTMYVLSATQENYNKITGEIKSPYLRYVIYMPYATAESTGLSLKPEEPGAPWLMDPGTHRAHIMINPPSKK